MAPSDEYIKALEKAVADLAEKVQSRDLINAEIAGLRETVRVLSARVSLTPDRQRNIAQLLAMVDYATPNLTDAIKALLIKAYPKELTAIEVRNALEESGFNFDDFSNSLSACHAALKRMVPDEIAIGAPREGKATYKALLKMPNAFTFSVMDWLGKPLVNLETLPNPFTDPVLPSHKSFGRKVSEGSDPPQKKK